MGWNEYQQQQAKVQDNLLKIDKLQHKLQAVKEQIQNTVTEIAYYDYELEKMRDKVKQLDSFSFVNLWTSWTGTHDELRVQAVDQGATAEMKRQELKKIMKDIQQDEQGIEAAITKLDEKKLNRELEVIIDKKKKWLSVNGSPQAEILEQAYVNETKAKRLKVEIEEAEYAGQQALETLYGAQKNLNSANSYSAWDTFFGGGLIATHMKHVKISESEGYLHAAQMELQRFRNELLDIQKFETSTLQIDTDGFVRFADYFFDDLFSAWSVHSKIATSKKQLNGVIDDVKNTLSKLQKKKYNIETEIEHYQRIKANILQLDEKGLYL